MQKIKNLHFQYVSGDEAGAAAGGKIHKLMNILLAA